MKITRTLLLLAAVVVLLLALTGCRTGARRLNRNEPAAATQPAAAATSQQPAATQAAPADAQPTLAAAEPTISGGDAELQDLAGQLDQIDKANQADDPLDDLPQ